MGNYGAKNEKVGGQTKPRAPKKKIKKPPVKGGTSSSLTEKSGKKVKMVRGADGKFTGKVQ